MTTIPGPRTLDAIVAINTAFADFAELVGAPGYRPSCDMRQKDMRIIADAYDRHMAKAGDPRRAYRYGEPDPLQAGQTAYMYVNQARRPTRVLAVAEGRALIEYDMPNGRSYLWDVPERTDLSDDTPIYSLRNVSPKRAPKRWQQVLANYE